MPDMGARSAGEADAGVASATAPPPGSATATAGGAPAETTTAGGVRAVEAGSDSGIPLQSRPPSTYDVVDVRSVRAEEAATSFAPPASAAAAAPVAATTERTYTVVSGDRGFWDVSVKMYGHGKHWPLIRDANPQADPQALQPGDKLRIPPLPVKARTPAAPAGASGVIVMPTADRPGKYVVEKGDDKGFWGIASKVYDMPAAWQAIRDANPDVRSDALQPGQELVLPARSALPQPRARRAASGAAAKSGMQTYTVMEGDSGFWTVSVKMYGSGKYWPVIAEANAGVEARHLKAGDVLSVPALTDELKRKYGAGSSGPSRPEPARIVETEAGRPPRPVFD
jgi:nucleoid-associated protein YgaU